MRFPLALTAKIAGHIIKHKLRRTPKFAMVLQLEPLHTCNLTCTGCGRIREYSTSLKDMVPLEKCLAVAEECDAPMVSICGGEPLIYPKIEELVNGILQQGRIVYICTNGMFMRKKMRDYLAAIYDPSNPSQESRLKRLLAEKLISDKDAETIRNSDEAAKKKAVIGPTQLSSRARMKLSPVPVMTITRLSGSLPAARKQRPSSACGAAPHTSGPPSLWRRSSRMAFTCASESL